MIDIHSHILPDFDDGAATMDEALAMAKHAAARGTTILFATPHITTWQQPDASVEISDRVVNLQKEIDRCEIPLRIVQGAEVYPSPEILDALSAGSPLTLGTDGRYMLLDTPLTSMPMGFEQLIFDLQTFGVTPILAHPERAKPVQEDPQILEQLIERGMLIQCNASSITGSHGSESEETAQILLRHHWAHFIASDAHSIGHRRTQMRAAAEALVEVIGQDQVDELFIRNGERILKGEAVPTNPVAYSQERKRSWFGQVFSKKRYCSA